MLGIVVVVVVGLCRCWCDLYNVYLEEIKSYDKGRLQKKKVKLGLLAEPRQRPPPPAPKLGPCYQVNFCPARTKLALDLHVKKSLFFCFVCVSVCFSFRSFFKASNWMI